MEKKLSVFLNETLVGSLWLDKRRIFHFSYCQDWIDDHRPPISLSLPVRPEPYEQDEAHPFFANLLPEAELRQVIARKLEISEKNDFQLLAKIGGECAGAISVLPEGSEPSSQESEYHQLGDEELRELIADLPRRPLLAGERGVRLSLAGAQNKLPIFIEDGRVSLPLGNAPSTHILKPPVERYVGMVENEYFCMTLAKRLGLNVPEVIIYNSYGENLYIVQRFDRKKQDQGGIIRVHQEDLCQALSVPPSFKYEAEGGPSFEQCFDLVKKRSTSPAIDIMAILEWSIFNVIIGNSDAHGKNISLMLLKEGPCLAPFYDLLSTRIYDDLMENLAMKIGGEKRPDWLQERHWERLAESAGVKGHFVLKLMRDLAERVPPEAERLAAEMEKSIGGSEAVSRVVELVRKASAKALRLS